VTERVRARCIDKTRAEEVGLEQPADATVVSRPPRWLRNTARSPGVAGARSGSQWSSHRTAIGPTGQKPLAPSLAAHFEKLLVAIDIVELETNEFADAEAAAVEGLEHCAVADAERGVERNCIEEPNHVINAKQAR